MKAITVRRATADDLAALTALEAAVFSEPWSCAAVAAHLTGEHTVTLLAEEGGCPLGYLFGLLLPPEGELLRVAALPKARRRGIASALLQGFIDILNKNGVSVCFLEVREGNLAARTLYERTGFVTVGRRRDYYRAPREDALLMKRG